MYEKLINWLESVTQPCVYVTLLGTECPGCGTQRAIIELLKGNFLESATVYPPIIPNLLLLLVLFIHLVFKLRKGASYLKILFVLNIIVMVLNYIYNLLTH